jgi:hypothetical protein
MEQKNPVYVRMDYNESLESKKNLLNTEVSLLNLIKSLKAYHSIRLEEMKIKAGIYKAIRELNLTMKKTKSSFPFFKIPEVKSRKEIPIEKEIKFTKEKTDNSLESELKEIQERLASLNR